MIIGRRKILLATLVVILGAAIFLNWYLGSTPIKSTSAQEDEASKNLGDAQYVIGTAVNTGSSSGSSKDFFSDAKLQRQQTRDKVLEELKSQDSTEATTAAAKVTENIKKETDIENLIKAKGIDECIATISDDSVSIVVECDELTDIILLQIEEIAFKQAQIPFENITIIKAK